MIRNLSINEIIPSEEDTPTVNYSSVFSGQELDKKIHEFFIKHVNNVSINPKTRNGRFINKISTILNSIEVLLNIKEENNINEKSISYPEDITDEQKVYYLHSKIIVDLLSHNTSKNAKHPFLFVILHLDHAEHGELIALLKMESHFGVQFSKSELKVQLNMLPDKERDLQKCALIFKEQLIALPVDSDFNNEHEVDFHTKILDKQDSNISQKFMTSFLDNNLITKDRENTKLATRHITNELLKFSKDGVKRTEIKSYLDSRLQNRNATSVEILIQDLVNNSNLIDNFKIEKSNLDIESLRNQVYTQMLNENKSAQQTFTAAPEFKDRKVIKDKSSDGKDLKVQIAQVMINKGVVKFDYENEIGMNTTDWMKIAIKRDIIDASSGEENSIIDAENTELSLDNDDLTEHSNYTNANKIPYTKQ